MAGPKKCFAACKVVHASAVHRREILTASQRLHISCLQAGGQSTEQPPCPPLFMQGVRGGLAAYAYVSSRPSTGGGERLLGELRTGAH
jgi:hypothetical protein